MATAPVQFRNSAPVIDEIRGAWQRISARFDHNPAGLVAQYMEMQEWSRERLIDPPKAARPTDEPAA
jgi:hypothetical protein